MSVFDKGDLIRVTGTFTNSAGTAVDPTAVNFMYRNPTGVIVVLVYGTDAAVVKSATGIYYVDVNANSAGTWWVRYESTGTGQAADEESFDVMPSEF